MANNEVQMRLTLYVGAGCHLCDLARDIVEEVLTEADGSADYEMVSVTGNATLMSAYGQRIPVVRNKAGREKGWPFTTGQIRKMLTD